MIESIEEFIRKISTDAKTFGKLKWFRGEPKNNNTSLVPALYRDSGLPENDLLQLFRLKASGYYGKVPDEERTDQWLFLAQHTGLPTRLLDWSEGALIALHFALEFDNPIVWMLDPLELNALSSLEDEDKYSENTNTRIIHLTFTEKNIGSENIAGAWERDKKGVNLPVAIYPSYVHSILGAKKSCFTVHGKDKRGINLLIKDNILKSYEINPACCKPMREELRLLGITDSVVFPDLNGLTKELKEFLKRS